MFMSERFDGNNGGGGDKDDGRSDDGRSEVSEVSKISDDGRSEVSDAHCYCRQDTV